MDFNKIKLYIDIIFCLVILPIVFTLVPVDRWIVKYPYFAISLLLFLYAMYFAVRFSRLPQKFLNKQFLFIIIFCLILFGLIFCISRFPFPQDAFDTTRELTRQIRIRYRLVWFLSLVVLGYSLSISLIVELYRQTMLKREIEEKHKSAELALYKTQINPHFFFNTLNTIYSLIITKSEKTEDAFVRFTELMKYSYSKIDNDHITIKEEVEYIRNYIELQKLRLNNATKVVFDCDVKNELLTIPPMMLISFIENAFKYGSSSSKDCEIKIVLKEEGGNILFIVENDVIIIPTANEVKSVGVENTKARLNILYPEMHEFESYEKAGRYYVKLKIMI